MGRNGVQPPAELRRDEELRVLTFNRLLRWSHLIADLMFPLFDRRYKHQKKSMFMINVSCIYDSLRKESAFLQLTINA